jgi:hypothetical protein
MKWFWPVIVSIEAALVVAFSVWAASVDYFVRMPASVRHGSSVSSMIATRAVWLVVILAVLNVSLAAWMGGVRHLETSKRGSALFLFSAGGALFLLAGWLLVIFIVFGFAQY